jgi:fructan beta-fructosidase
MTTFLKIIPIAAIVVSCSSVKSKTSEISYFKEQHRPQVHFTPKSGWMNDPNGMVYHNGTYHLFYQHYPDSTVWGPMHWGHATSKDMIYWEHQPIALYPDSLGYIFSGSAVADVANTSGFGKDGKVPLVAIFTHHDPKGEKEGRNDFQYQSIAYSLDEGKTWTKYAGNPVVKNPGIRAFRDPKVSWHEETKKWIMTLATQDRVTFFSSPDLKTWTKESEFGEKVGAHGGVWECPDLFSLTDNGKKVWVLLVSLNPGGPNSGSATQYFTGDFDGHTFKPFQTDTRWLDYGPDNYAGVTWSNTGERKIFLGWMSNWQYAETVPTQKWRSATTLPRELALEKIGEKYFVRSQPVKELEVLTEQPVVLQNIDATNYDLTAKTGVQEGPARIKLTIDKPEDFTLMLSNNSGQKVVIGYNKGVNQYFIDRTASGKVDFEKGFAARHTAPRISTSEKLELTLVIDNASVELFADNGLSVMTQVFYPDSILSKVTINGKNNFKIATMEYTKLKSMYEVASLARQ